MYWHPACHLLNTQIVGEGKTFQLLWPLLSLSWNELFYWCGYSWNKTESGDCNEGIPGLSHPFPPQRYSCQWCLLAGSSFPDNSRDILISCNFLYLCFCILVWVVDLWVDGSFLQALTPLLTNNWHSCGNMSTKAWGGCQEAAGFYSCWAWTRLWILITALQAATSNSSSFLLEVKCICHPGNRPQWSRLSPLLA